jgi:Family of unknown function (DUF6152)
MRFTIAAAAIGTAVACLTVPALAHHSLKDTHDLSRTVTLAGVVSSVEWVNPHARLHLDVRGADGATVTWIIDLGAPNTMIRYGLTPAVLKPDDRIRADVWIAKDNSPSASAQTLTLPDGRTAHVAAPWAP